MIILACILAVVLMVGSFIVGFFYGLKIDRKGAEKAKPPKPSRPAPRYVLHGGEIQSATDGTYYPVGPAALAQHYGLKRSEWVAANPRISKKDQDLYYGRNVIHLCPLYSGNYKTHLKMVTDLYYEDTRNNDVIIEAMFEQERLNHHYIEYKPVSKR